MKFTLSTLALGLAASATAAATECNADSCCAALAKKKSLKDKVLFKDSPTYEARLDSYFSANAAQEAWCMVMPESTDDVSDIAKVLFKNKCPFGMRSGAHSAWKGSNGAKDGITIDFSYMNETVYDQGSKLAKIQPGSDWGRVFEKLDPYGVTAVGGRASVVGVGGFTTGGGYSFHTSRHGFACDNIDNFEVVLYDGKVVNANKKENPDLYLALKGGSGNFGFVTRIDARTIGSTQMWGGFTSYLLEKRDDVFKAYLKFNENMEKDTASQNIIALYYDKTGFALRAILTNIDAVPYPDAFKGYMAIKNESSTARISSVAELVPEFTGPTPLGLYANWFVGQATNELEVLQFIDEQHKAYVQKMKDAAPGSDFNVLVQFQPVTKNIVDHAKENGGNVLGLEKVVKDGPTLMWLVALTVDNQANQDKILPLAQELVNKINKHTSKKGTNKDWVYLNYAWKDQDPIATFGNKNINFLKKVSKDYDPKGFFQKQRITGFKLP